jgi:hypothetical protein
VSRAGCPHPNEAYYEVERSCCCYHAATRTPRTRSIQEHHHLVRIVGNQSTPTLLIFIQHGASIECGPVGLPEKHLL